MSNINWGQILNNFANNLNRVNISNVQNNTSETYAQQNQQSTLAQILFPAASAQLSQTTAELASLNETQTVNMLKELLNLSKNFDTLISQLTTNSQQLNQQTALLLLAANIDLSRLSSLLQNNSKTAMTNLYQMLAQYNQVGVSMKDEQLSTLTKLISFVSSSSNSDTQALRTIMIMYLPWLPLTDPNVFKLEIANGGNEGGSSSSDSISILIQTENYGNLQAEIHKTEEDGIKIVLVSSQTFPQKELTDLMKEESIKYNININFELSKKEAFNKKKNEQSQTQIFMNTSPGVNPFLLLMSNAFIKNVHIIDSKENLREQRKERLNG